MNAQILAGIWQHGNWVVIEGATNDHYKDARNASCVRRVVHTTVLGLQQ